MRVRPAEVEESAEISLAYLASWRAAYESLLAADVLDIQAQPSGLLALVEADVPLIHHHTSSHAHPDDLARLVHAFGTARVVPTHSEATDRFADHFPRVEAHADHEWWEV